MDGVTFSFFFPQKNAYLQLHWIFFCCNNVKIHPEKKPLLLILLNIFFLFSISLFTRCKIESSFDEMQNLQVTNKKKMKMLQCSSNATLQTMQVLQ